ncbi:MAG TPA: hypothetical protein PKC49_01320 [Phycisphaerae bacterium]|nr:hypothetical protein [Phycisphaerae bacterium]
MGSSVAEPRTHGQRPQRRRLPMAGNMAPAAGSRQVAWSSRRM